MTASYPWEVNRTPEQARLRVLEARVGSLDDATSLYLATLRTEVQAWLAQIDRELAVRIAAERAVATEEEQS